MLNDFVFSYNNLYDYLIKICNSFEIDKIHSSDVCKSILDAELSGYKSHGLELLRTYLHKILLKKISNNGTLNILNETENSLYIDSNNLLGPYVLSETLRLSFPKAIKVPIFMFVIKDCESIGSIRYYLKMAEQYSLISLLFVCSHLPIVAPLSSKGRILGTNPIGAFFSSTKNPFLVDTSCSIVSLRETLLNINETKTDKEPWIATHEGVLTSNPEVLIKQATSFLLPIGGKDHGYKGMCIGLINELLGRGLTGEIGSNDKNSLVGFLINPSFFEGWNSFCKVSDHIQTQFTKMDCRYPGMMSLQKHQDRQNTGIHINNLILSSLFRMAKNESSNCF